MGCLMLKKILKSSVHPDNKVFFCDQYFNQKSIGISNGSSLYGHLSSIALILVSFSFFSSEPLQLSGRTSKCLIFYGISARIGDNSKFFAGSGIL